MILTARTRTAIPEWCVVGTRVRAEAPTCLQSITGVVQEVNGLVVTISTSSGMEIAVDIEDCRPA